MLCCYTWLLATGIYSNQQMLVRRQSSSFPFFNIAVGVRQGGHLWPFLFLFYIHDLIDMVTTFNLGCNFAVTVINLLAYAEDMIIITPCWRALNSIIGC